MDNTVFGLTEEQITEIGLTWGIGGFILLMLFIIISVGIFGFLLKQVIQWWLGLE
jgi:hypothetical protein